jgi:hypothetical protein
LSTVKILVPCPAIAQNQIICSIYSHGHQQEREKTKHLQPPTFLKKSRLKKDRKLPICQHFLVSRSILKRLNGLVSKFAPPLGKSLEDSAD